MRTKSPKHQLAATLAGALLLASMPTHAGAAGKTPNATGERPNVIFVLMDDLGWNDLGYTGGKFYESPNIDRLSKKGVVFTRAYAAPICSPSRASIMTGLDPATTGFTSPRGGDPLEVLKAHVQPRIYTQEELKTNWKELPGGMKAAPPNQRALQVVSASRLTTNYQTLAKTFKANGYATGHFGKWHLGPSPYSPLEHGFDVDVPHVNSPGPMGGHLGPWKEWLGENGPNNKGRNIDDCLADHAIQFIQKNKDRPFLLDFWTYGVHVPIQARQEIVDYFKAKGSTTGQNNPVYAAMIKSTDAAVGKLWKAIEDAGLAEKTILLFYSDNGGVNIGTPQITDNSPLRDGKGSLYEGGVRVPGYLVWPGVTKAGTRCEVPINTRDIFPTLAEACGLKNLPKVDGRSFVPALAGKPMEEKPIFGHLPYYGWGDQAPATTVVFDGWKLFRRYFEGPGRSHGYELYNLAEDPGESLDYHRSRPDMVAKLSKLIDDYEKQTQAVLPVLNPDFHGAAKGESEGVAYEVSEPMYKRSPRFPLIVCLAGEKDNPAYEALQTGAVQNKHSAFLLSVKCPRSGDSIDARKVTAVIEKVLAENPTIEPRRVYLTGEGEGATDLWALAQASPGLFAAALPVGGSFSAQKAAALKEMPIWIFRGANSPKAPGSNAQEMEAALKTAGLTAAQLTVYDKNEQVQLDAVWENKAVLEWLYKQASSVRKKTASLPTPAGENLTDNRLNPMGLLGEQDEDFDPDVTRLCEMLGINLVSNHPAK
ncbi:MAG: sulfatase-like hydrolase/transferase [Verrucomicrobiota bacterium]